MSSDDSSGCSSLHPIYDREPARPEVPDSDLAQSLTQTSERDNFVAPVASNTVTVTSRLPNPPNLTFESAGPLPQPDITSKERFQDGVHRVITARRQALLTLSAVNRVGAEPGVDPRRASANVHYAHIRQQCVIELVDYSTERCSFGRMANSELVDMLSDDAASQREPWAAVRWINVGGISWDVISALALRYDMHPLAVEDLLHHPYGHARSKADYYPKHLFLRLLCHQLGHDGDSTLDSSLGHLPLDILQHSGSPDSETEKEKGYDTADEERAEYGVIGSRQPPSRSSMRRRWDAQRRAMVDVEAVPPEKIPTRPPLYPSWSARLLHIADKHAEDMKLIQKLKKGARVNVKHNPVCIFLFHDGEDLALTTDSNLDFTTAILDRLRQSDTVLRTSADPSLLVESLIDLTVDQALEIVDDYQEKILDIEKAVLLKPNMSTVTSLHMLQEDLIMHKRGLEPIKTLVYGLRRYDIDRASAVVGTSRGPDDAKHIGFMSEKSKIYLADVYDHLEYIIMNLDMFASISDNLINYTCNMVSYQLNDVMRLTIVTIVFLPLSFISGYFGMNFSTSWPQTSVMRFWEIALPVMAVTIPVFLWPDIQRLVRYIEKQVIRRQVRKVCRLHTVHEKQSHTDSRRHTKRIN
ncbi:hypothetical protein WOLCODRAFT_82117 [Wolfiporia cocos MD-104 SS10]|uniref:Cora-domain-containing protein n=1 Tax=Wolfiporia cocos (strain MD-104) TaxID=742152 RepID=A0A2H3JK64_WOLCO|nr:hypothetical protein WOLCODRAFT_82117 [Wolfiporia cocos MD-104 SS10]